MGALLKKAWQEWRIQRRRGRRVSENSSGSNGFEEVRESGLRSPSGGLTLGGPLAVPHVHRRQVRACADRRGSDGLDMDR